MSDNFEIIDVTSGNIDRQGFFCYMSKRKTPGYQQKRDWLERRLAEGLKIKILHEHGGRDTAFIEYIPGEYAWRAVHAPGYLVIHCLWVVGKSKGRGFSAALLDSCVADARRQKRKGVAVVVSEQVWMAGRRVFDQQGFECVDTAPPAFTLMVKRFSSHPLPSFAGKWEQKAGAFGKGLTVVRSNQCPYIVDATAAALATAGKAGIKSRVVELESRDDLLRLSPSPYGVFGLVLDGKLLSYHYLLEKDLLPLLGGAP